MPLGTPRITVSAQWRSFVLFTPNPIDFFLALYRNICMILLLAWLNFLPNRLWCRPGDAESGSLTTEYQQGWPRLTCVFKTATDESCRHQCHKPQQKITSVYAVCGA